jgi:release factor glutamine methyltransferase
VTATWRDVEDDVRALLAGTGVDDPAHDARRIVEQASGWDGAELVVHADEHAVARAHEAALALAERRSTGEPLQYVIGRWGFRTLDLMVDRRVLIPRPETEVVAGIAIDALAGLGRDGVVVDLGTGSGAIALAVVAERWPHVEVWASDASPDALAVARANLAGLGRRGAAARIVEGDWYDALPDALRGRVDVIVSNPPYVAANEVLPLAVADWEPAAALVSGPTGLEAIERVVAGAHEWLTDAGTLVVEIGETQGDAVLTLATDAGFATARIAPDLTGRDRVLVATWAAGRPTRG